MSEIKEIYFIIDPVHGLEKDSVSFSKEKCIRNFINECYSRIDVSCPSAMRIWEDFEKSGFKVQKINLDYVRKYKK